MTTSIPPRLDQIIDATRALFARYGYRRTAMDDIAREAGVAKATLYLHFSGKEEIFRAMVTRCRALITERCEQAVKRNAPVADRLVALLDAYFGTALEWFGDASHLGELRVLMNEGSLAPTTESEDAFRETLCRFLEGAVMAGELDPARVGLSPDAVAATLIYAAVGAKHARLHTIEAYRAELCNLTTLTVAALAPAREGVRQEAV